MTQHRSATGALPTAEQTAAVGILQGAMAYKKAREWAEQGYDPGVCARQAQKWSTFKIVYWLYVGPWAIFCAAFMWTPLLFLWKLPLILLAVVLYQRLQAFGQAPPNVRCRYGIPTWVLISAWSLWNVIFILGLLVSLIITKPVGVS